MSEDYTWDETVTEHGYAVQNAGLKRDNATLAQRVMELERENAELRARLEAVPDYATYYYNFDGWEPVMSFDEWYAATRAPDEPDAPLTVAAIDDKDGDL